MVEPDDKNPRSSIEGLVCPQTRLPLEPATGELLDRLVERQGRGELRTIAGEVIAEVPTGAWVRNDGALLYPVIDGIARMLIEDAVLLEGEDWTAGE